ncbi:MAG: hypothetical protein LC730_03845 [Acidobacteria bacterium]|nr:hypothetical protein [Acidobacteriota bacterium]
MIITVVDRTSSRIPRLVGINRRGLIIWLGSDRSDDRCWFDRLVDLHPAVGIRRKDLFGILDGFRNCGRLKRIFRCRNKFGGGGRIGCVNS